MIIRVILNFRVRSVDEQRVPAGQAAINRVAGIGGGENPQHLKCCGGSATGRGAALTARQSPCSPPRNSHAGLDGTVGSGAAAFLAVSLILGSRARCFFAPRINPPATADSERGACLFVAANPPVRPHRLFPWPGSASSRPRPVIPRLSFSLGGLGEKSSTEDSGSPTIWPVLLQTALCNHNRFS